MTSPLPNPRSSSLTEDQVLEAATILRSRKEIEHMDKHSPHLYLMATNANQTHVMHQIQLDPSLWDQIQDLMLRDYNRRLKELNIEG